MSLFSKRSYFVPTAQGLGAGSVFNGYGQGAGHGGAGGGKSDGLFTAGTSAAYGSFSEPTHPGSGGGGAQVKLSKIIFDR